jgi:hypothetical protein
MEIRMRSILDDCRDRFEEHKAHSHQLFATKAIKRVCAYFDITLNYSDLDEEFGCGWFNHNYPKFPVYLDAKNIKVEVGPLFRSITKTAAWTELISLLESIGGVCGGVIIPVTGQGLFVAHNWWTIPEVPGFTRLVRKASATDQGIVIEPLESFLEGVKLSGWCP